MYSPYSFHSVRRRLFPFRHGFTWFKKGLALALISYSAFSAQHAIADNQIGELSEERLSVYTPINKLYVGRLPAITSYNVVSDEGRWRYVRFTRSEVPVWVSEKYVRRSGSTVTVTTDSLNARIRPSLKAPVLSQISAGYRSKILESRNGFAQILAPREWQFAIHRDSRVKKYPEDQENKPVFTPVSDSETTQTSNRSRWATALDSLAPKQNPVAREKSETRSIDVKEPTKEAQTDRSSLATIKSRDRERQYRISPGDTISLLVFGEPDLSAANLRVPQSGSISFPLIGNTVVRGKTTKEIEDSIRAELSQGYIKNPRLSVTVVGYRPVFIRGAVGSTGSFPYSEGLTIAKALALAGGVKKSAKTNGISILREGNTIQSDLSSDSQYEVLSGDIITVAEEIGVSDEDGFYIYLHGEVNRPGEYNFRRGLTVEKAIVLAGGFTLRASRRKISVSRQVEGQEAPEKLKKVKLYLPIEPGDIIRVGASLF